MFENQVQIITTCHDPSNIKKVISDLTWPLSDQLSV